MVIFELTEDEKSSWKKTIRETRNSIVQEPAYYITNFVAQRAVNPSSNSISTTIITLRKGAWNLYLKDESAFHIAIFNKLLRDFDGPSDILRDIVAEQEELHLEKFEMIKESFGKLSGAIMPYIYEITLSTTNSRRSRAGQTFEHIIAYLMNLLNYPYTEQASLGDAFYKNNHLGKLVDGIIPSKEAYEADRSKCCIVSMKMSFRERRQQVVEEISRTNLSNLYLLTLDPNITDNALIQMKQHNIIIVNLTQNISKANSHTNLITFESFFYTHIPHTLKWFDDHDA